MHRHTWKKKRITTAGYYWDFNSECAVMRYNASLLSLNCGALHAEPLLTLTYLRQVCSSEQCVRCAWRVANQHGEATFCPVDQIVLCHLRCLEVVFQQHLRKVAVHLESFVFSNWVAAHPVQICAITKICQWDVMFSQQWILTPCVGI